LLKAGYMEEWRYHESLSGTPQGGIISPLLANIYLNELDKFVEDTLMPAYTKGNARKKNPEYRRIQKQAKAAHTQGNREEAKRLRAEYRKLATTTPSDYRRLRYVRYADDFLLGFVGPKNEAEEIRRRLGEFLEQRLKLTLSPEKTLITHALDGKAKFLGYEISVARVGHLISENGRRATNGRITLWMPHNVAQKYRDRFSKEGRITHRTDLLDDSDYTILQRFQSILLGVYNYYCMAINVSTQMGSINWTLETSMLKTLACKLQCSVSAIARKYRVADSDHKMFRVVIERPDKAPLVAVFGGFPLERIPEGLGVTDFRFDAAWFKPGDKRSEVVQRLIAGKCELCGWDGLVAVHHIRRLADIDRPGRRPRTPWEKIMSARKRKTLVVCEPCHEAIHAGRYDGPSPG